MGRYVTRRGHPSANRRLTPADVVAIRAAVEAGETRHRVGERFGVSRSQVNNIVWRTQWAHVP